MNKVSSGLKAALAPDCSEPLSLGCWFRACLVLLITVVVAAFASCSLVAVALVLSLLEWFRPPDMSSLEVYITSDLVCWFCWGSSVTNNHSCWVRFVSVGVLIGELDSVGEFS